jgi:RNA polymerase sigma factor (TIGR02999 family)
VARAGGSHDPTELLVSLSGGDRAALDEFIPLVYRELRRLAGGYLRGERPGHTLQPTALANEVYLRLVDLSRIELKDRTHFFAIAGRMMRRVLIDHARRHRAQKRGGPATRIVFDEAAGQPAPPGFDPTDLADALASLEQMDERQARIVELRFFGGLTVEEIAQVLDVSTPTVKREWRTARAWLCRELSEGGAR